MSKTGALCSLLEAAGAADPLVTPLTRYHAAKDVVNALRMRSAGEQLVRARRALKRFNVRVEFVGGYLTVTTLNRSHIWREGALLVSE
jgi:hypothetical protein